MSWQTTGNADWTPTVTLNQAVGRFSKTLKVNLVQSPAIGSGAIINDEIVRIDGVDLINGIITVGRGCADTLPTLHPIGSSLRFFQNAIEGDGREYLAGETIDVRLLARTSQQMLDPLQAPIEHLTFSARQAKPYLPGNIRLNDELYPLVAEPAEEYILTWSHRDRQLQADRLIDYLESSIGPELGVNYVITIVKLDTQESVWTETVSVETLVLPYSSELSSENAIHSVTIKSIRDDITSMNQWVIELPEGHYVNEPPTEPEQPEGIVS
ncbi:hypothetical protein [Serratia sp. (in: enterobacteria)]|uniref:hypothetical protein n=1 Tax=Serratia sp. (in: enterobacteria) TaxID=616 RepID=UPI003989DB74